MTSLLHAYCIEKCFHANKCEGFENYSKNGALLNAVYYFGKYSAKPEKR